MTKKNKNTVENVLRILENLNFSHDIQKKILLKSAYNKKALEILSTNVQISDPFSKKLSQGQN